VQKRWHSEALLEGHTSAPPIWACRVPRKDVTAHVSGKAETWRSPSGWVVPESGVGKVKSHAEIPKFVV